MPETRTKLRLLPALLCALLPVLAVAQPQPGTLDTTFDAQSTLNSWVNAIHVRSDGNILIAGAFSSAGYLKLLLPGGGSAAGFSASTPQQINALKVQTDGKVLIAGEFNSVNGTGRKFIARLTSSGSVDTSFDPQTGPDNYIHALALQTDGKIVMGGSFTSYRGSSVPRVARLNADGSLDSAFTPGSGANDEVYGLLVEPSGKIVIVGRFTSYDGIARNRIARLNANGTLDTGFTVGTGASSNIRGVTAQGDGKLVIVGDFASYNGTSAPAVARVNTGGSLDTTFVSPLAGQTLRSVALQADGKVVVGGSAVRRLNANGSLDPTFAVAGVTTLVHSLALQADGKILVGGNFNQIGGVSRAFMARLHGGNAVAPTITAQPQSQTASIGQTVTFSVTASGTQTLAYRWRKNGSFISGATSSSYSVVNVQASSAGNYDVEVSNVAGIVFSQPANLTVNAPPSISAQPVNKTAFVGQSTFFSVSVSGSSPLSFQWRKEGANISGATSQSYFIGSVQASQAGGYSVVVSNPYGTVTSDTATLTVSSAVAPNISSHPQSRQVDVGQSVTFSVSATGSPSPSFQWRKNGTAIPGETGTSYTIGSVQPSHAGTYDVVASNIAGTAASSPALLTVGNAPLITAHPTNQIVTAGATVTLSVAASGTAPLSYQWRRDGTNIAGANSGALILNSAQPGDSGYYSAVVTNSLGVAVSSAAAINILPAGGLPNRVLNFDGDGDFVVIADAPDLQPTTAFTIEGWFLPLENTSNHNAHFINKGDGADGRSARSYELSWKTNRGLIFSIFLTPLNEVDPDYLEISVDAPPQIWVHFAATFDSLARQCQVFTNGVLAASSALAPGKELRQCSLPLIFGSMANFTGTDATGRMDEIRLWSRARTAEEIAGAMFCRLAGNEPGLAGYWTFDDGTASDLTGHGHHGAFSGNAATVTLLGTDPLHSTNQTPCITSQPQSLTVGIGQSASFAVTAVAGTNAGPFNYQWRKDGTNLAGATSFSYGLFIAGTNQAGSYSVVVSNTAGSVTSTEATLTVVSFLPPASMALIPAGSFQMGDTFSEGGSGELPVHSVYVSAFYMDRYEVTKALWDEVKAWNGGNGYGYDNVGSGKAPTHPVHTVSWFDMVKWCNARSEKEGRMPVYYTDAGFTQIYKTGQVTPYPNWTASGYRLPTEAEWEKAARGGASGRRFPWSDADTINQSRANYDSFWSGGVPFYSYDVNSTSGNHPAFSAGAAPYTSPVGFFAPNGYGLYDMAGNVWERCWDWYGAYSSGFQINPSGATSGLKRVQRGGSSGSGADCRTALRGDSNPADGYFTIGFRSVLSPPASPGIGVTVTTAKVGDSLSLLWPNPGPAYRVESALSLSPPALWSTEAASLQTNGDTISLTVPVSGPHKFFRLVNP